MTLTWTHTLPILSLILAFATLKLIESCWKRRRSRVQRTAEQLGRRDRQLWNHMRNRRA